MEYLVQPMGYSNSDCGCFCNNVQTGVTYNDVCTQCYSKNICDGFCWTLICKAQEIPY